MLRKKLMLLLMLLTLLVSVAAPRDTSASCSGDNCGCGYYAEECRYDCQQEPPEYYYICVRGCNRESVQCAKACCAVY
ncbi:MAG TPA: hypothetical protein VGB98_01005 [Pyrinomonadaceae bacterium]|jgi:hypothetical protein